MAMPDGGSVLIIVDDESSNVPGVVAIDFAGVDAQSSTN